MDFENDHGMVGCFGMDKNQYDEGDHIELAYMLIRVIDAWMKRREFFHQNIEHYKRLC